MKFDERPFIAIWETTQACDLACAHCRAEAKPERNAGELSNAEAKRMLDEFAEAGVPLVILTGGDPAKRPDLVDLVRYGTEQGLFMGLTPSATPLITEELLCDLKSAGLCRLAMSIDGLHADMHDQFRGAPGSFARTQEVLQTAHRLGIPTQVNTTIHRGTIHALDEMAQLMSQLQIQLWSVFTIVPTGRASEAMMPGATAVEEAFGKLVKLAKKMPFAIKTTAGPHYRRLALEERKASGEEVVIGARGQQAMWVNEGRGLLFVSHKGEVFPSGFLPLPCGQVREKNPIDIYKNHPVFQTLRDSDCLKGKCRACVYRKVCGGGRARALAMTGDLMASDPICPHVPDGYDGPADIFEGRKGPLLPMHGPGPSGETD